MSRFLHPPACEDHDTRPSHDERHPRQRQRALPVPALARDSPAASCCHSPGAYVCLSPAHPLPLPPSPLGFIRGRRVGGQGAGQARKVLSGTCKFPRSGPQERHPLADGNKVKAVEGQRTNIVGARPKRKKKGPRGGTDMQTRLGGNEKVHQATCCCGLVWAEEENTDGQRKGKAGQEKKKRTSGTVVVRAR